ncbi:MAG: hypothetical protein ABJC09_09535 [Terriglobia bacterium]
MRRLLISAGIAAGVIGMLPLAFAQQAPVPAVSPAPATTPAAPASPASDATPATSTPIASAAAEARPAGEYRITGSLDVGYRWLDGPGGSFETYRSVVNLGSGVKLIGLDLAIANPSRKWFENAHIRAFNWGNDPYATFHADAEKSRIYRLNVDYRGISYFNNLPSYADPLLAKGITLNEQSFDTHRRLSSVRLEILPGRAFTPYVSAERDARSGSVVTVFHSDNNDYPVAGVTRDSTNLVRAGVRISFRRVRATLEEGYTNFRNDQSDSTGPTNYGNTSVQTLGQTLDLTSLAQSYGIRGNSHYTKADFTASPFSWADIYAQFTYTTPHTTVNYTQYDTGSLVLLNQVLFFSGQQYLVNATASFPHTTANAGWEIRPYRRVRILQSFQTDRMTNTGSAAQADTLLAGTATVSQTALALASTLGMDSSQVDISILFDAGRKFTLRGGYRYVWGNANDVVSPQEGLYTIASEKLQRNIGMGAVSWRPSQKVLLSGDAEVGTSAGTYFRTSLYDYQKVRAMGRYKLLKSWQISGDFRILMNRNPLAGSSYHFLSRQESATLTWLPSGKKLSVDATWEHCTYQSTVSYLIPQLLVGADSVYSEDCHRISGMLNATLRGLHKRAATLEAGGAAVITTGSRPTTDYQPTARLTAPLTKNVAAFGEWRYYGFGESFYQYESFRAHLVTVGLRFTR